MRFRGFATFRARIFWSFVPIVLFILALHGVANVLEHRQLVTEEFMKRGETLAGNLAYSSELGVFTENAQLLESSMRGIIGDADVAYVVVYGENGNVVAKGGRQVGQLAGEALAPPAVEPASSQPAAPSSIKTVRSGTGRFIEFVAPIVSEEARPPDEILIGRLGPAPSQVPPGRQRVLGSVRLGLSLQRLDQQVVGLVTRWMGVAIAFIALSTVAVYVFSRRITRPVKQLTDQAQQIADGVLDQVIPVQSRDEIGQLAATFNDMARALKGNIAEKERILAELQNLNRTLEDRIRQRTAELEERTAALEHSLEEVRAMGEISRAVSSSLDLREVLDTVSAHAVRLTGTDACGIFEIDPARNAFVVVAAHNLSERFTQALQGSAVDPRQSAVSRAVEGGRAFEVSDVVMAPEFAFHDILLEEGFRALLAVPMASAGIVRGMVVYRKEPGRVDDRAVNLLTTLANQSRVAIDNARLFQEVQSQRTRLENLSRNMEQLYRLSIAMQEPLSLKEQLARVLEASRQVVAIDRFYLWSIDPAGTMLKGLSGAGFSEDEWREVEGAEIPLAEAGAMSKAYREGTPLVFNDENPLPPELRLTPPYSALQAVRTRSFLVVPMIARGRTVGLLTADNKWSRKPILPQTVELLQIFASDAAVAIENARLFQEIEEKGHQLELASKHKSQFLANMSHELRTPLNAVLGYIELTLDGILGEVPEPIRDGMERARTNGLHLLGLINDVLDLSKIEAGQLVLSLGDYAMEEVVYSVVTAVESLVSEKRLVMTATVAPGLPPGRGDARRITQVLMNLVGNAVKFTEAGEVRVEATTSNGAFLVSVSDTGPGISATDRQRIFEEFQQADTSSTRKKGGTGLGLAIARRIVELHGGRIWVESTVGQGSTFRFSVPVRVERQATT